MIASLVAAVPAILRRPGNLRWLQVAAVVGEGATIAATIVATENAEEKYTGELRRHCQAPYLVLAQMAKQAHAPPDATLLLGRLVQFREPFWVSPCGVRVFLIGIYSRDLSLNKFIRTAD